MKSGYLSLGPLKQIKTLKSIHTITSWSATMWVLTKNDMILFSWCWRRSNKMISVPYKSHSWSASSSGLNIWKQLYWMWEVHMRCNVHFSRSQYQNWSGLAGTWQCMDIWADIGELLCLQTNVSNEHNDKGEVVLQFWEFAHKIRCESTGTQFCTKHNLKHRRMCNAEINDAIMKLYENVESYTAEYCSYFDLPLALRLCKPLWLWHWWLINARILVSKSEKCARIGHMMLNQYYPHLTSARTLPNQPRQIESIQQYVQTSLWNLLSPQLVSGWKSISHSL
jgi:hypothetical protein